MPARTKVACRQAAREVGCPTWRRVEAVEGGLGAEDLLKILSHERVQVAEGETCQCTRRAHKQARTDLSYLATANVLLRKNLRGRLARTRFIDFGIGPQLLSTI